MQENEQQRKAIVWNTGPALILAGPGSGKTFTTVERVRYLIRVHHVDPSQILVITFTKAAARQMRDRFFDGMEGSFHPVTFGTFHAVFFQILKNSCHYEANSILGEKEKREYLQTVFLTVAHELPEEEGWEDGILSEIGYLKNMGRFPDDFQSAYLERPLFQKLFVSFQRQLARMGKLDLDDFAAMTEHLFLTRPQALALWRQRFSYFLIDEFQDINAAQYRVMRMLSGPQKNLFAVGDDDQAIYGFRGADPGVMRQFVKDYPEAETIRLSVNYRCSAGIVETAGRLIRNNRERFPKEIRAAGAAGRGVPDAGSAAGPPQWPEESAAGLPSQSGEAVPGAGGAIWIPPSVGAAVSSEGSAQTRLSPDGDSAAMSGTWRPLTGDRTVWEGSFPDRRAQAECLAEMMKALRDAQSSRTAAAIFRTHSDCALLAEELEKRKIPFRMKERVKNPYEQPVCRDLYAYLSFAEEGQRRKDFFRIMNKPCRYLSRQMITEEQVSFGALLLAYRDKPYMQPILKKMQADAERMRKMDLYAAVSYVRRGMGYDEWLKKELEGEALREAVAQADFFRESVRSFETVGQLKEHMESYGRALLEAAKKEEAGADGEICLTTMHGAKGLEFDVVFLPDCNEGIVPHKKSMKGSAAEEERRIFYVGMTRAKERLYLSWVSGTKEAPGFASRFLSECGCRIGMHRTVTHPERGAL